MGIGIKDQDRKKSFVLYTDTRELWESLSDEQAGKLIKHIYSYAVGEDPDSPDEMTKLLSIQIKKTLDRDQNKWEEVKKARSKNGKKGGGQKKQKKQLVFPKSKVKLKKL